MTQQTQQTTLDGVWVPILPPVRTSDGHILEWDRERIVQQIQKETKLVETFYGYTGATVELARRAVSERGSPAGVGPGSGGGGAGGAAADRARCLSTISSIIFGVHAAFETHSEAPASMAAFTSRF